MLHNGTIRFCNIQTINNRFLKRRPLKFKSAQPQKYRNILNYDHLRNSLTILRNTNDAENWKQVYDSIYKNKPAPQFLTNFATKHLLQHKLYSHANVT